VAARKDCNLRPGGLAVLTEIPGLLHGLPARDKRAISEIVGKPILFNEYDPDGRTELEFRNRHGGIHFI
jgi:hypothetical protein